MAQQIYYLIAYDVDSGKWINADHVLGLLTQEGPLYSAESDEKAGSWAQIEDPGLIDQDFENTQLIGDFLRQVNK
jgi:hypothetical protein